VDDAHLLVFARCAGFVFRAPGFSHPSVPAPVRAGFAYALSLPLSHPGFGRLGSVSVFAVTGEVVVGAAIGIAASMLYDGAYAGGRALDDFVGIRASVPSANVSAGAGFGRLWSLAFVAAFFVLGADRIALDGFAQSFVTLPPGALVATPGLATFAVALPVTLVRAAVFVAGPAISLALIAQLGLAIVARLVPRFSTFALAFPVALGCAVLATIAALPFVLHAAAAPWWDLSPLRAR
jgi:flagellar biosynthesis protein FliR